MSIAKNNYTSEFTFVGRAVINDKTFKLGAVSESGWEYSSMNLGIDCGENGRQYASLMGGHSTIRESVIYVHGKDENGRDDWKNRFTIDWDDREDDDVLDTIGDRCFFPATLEKTNSGSDFTKKFLSAYDAVPYIAEHLADGDAVIVRGNLKFDDYNDSVSIKKEITSIRKIEADDNFNPKATFRQSVLLTSDSVTKDSIDKEAGMITVSGYALEYKKELNGVEVKCNCPIAYDFKYKFDNEEMLPALMKQFFKVKKGFVNMVNWEGEFVSEAPVVEATLDDIPEDIKVLIDLGLYTEEEVLKKAAGNGTRTNIALLKKPIIRMEGEEENKQMVLQLFEGHCTEDELFDVLPHTEEVWEPVTDDDELSWLDEI